VSEAGVPAVTAGNAFPLYAEASGGFDTGAIGAFQTGLAIANASASPAFVALALFGIDCSGVRKRSPAFGQQSKGKRSGNLFGNFALNRETDLKLRPAMAARPAIESGF
jgi:hypothetical protein